MKSSFLSLICIIVASISSTAATEDGFSTLKRLSIGLSEENREGKDIMVVVQPVGYGPVAGTSSGLAIGFFATANSIFLIDATYGRSSGELIDFGSLYGDHTDVVGSSVGIHFKQFLGNSFYMRVGLDQRHVEYSTSQSGSYWFGGKETTYTSRYTGDSTAGNIAIGNQWQFSGFTIGCDWFGIITPLVSTISTEKFTGTASPSGNSRVENSRKQFVTGSSIQAVRFYLGASF